MRILSLSLLTSRSRDGLSVRENLVQLLLMRYMSPIDDAAAQGRIRAYGSLRVSVRLCMGGHRSDTYVCIHSMVACIRVCVMSLPSRAFVCVIVYVPLARKRRRLDSEPSSRRRA